MYQPSSPSPPLFLKPAGPTLLPAQGAAPSRTSAAATARSGTSRSQGSASTGWSEGSGRPLIPELPPFVATLGMLSIARGLTMLWTGGFPITGLGPTFGYIGTGSLLGVPVPVWLVGALVALFTLVERQTVFGRHVFALGSNEATARLCGVPTVRLKIVVYFVAGCFFGLAGLFQLSRLRQGDPTVAVGLELDIIAAVIVGGLALLVVGR